MYQSLSIHRSHSIFASLETSEDRNFQFPLHGVVMVE